MSASTASKALKPGHGVKPGDVLTIVLNTRVRVLQVEALGGSAGARPRPPAAFTASPACPDPGGRNAVKRGCIARPELARQPFGLKNG